MRKHLWLAIIASLSIQLTAQVGPNPGIKRVSDLLCTGLPITFSAITGAAANSYSWSVFPTKGVKFSTSTNSPTFKIIFENPVTYSIKLTVTDSSGSGSTTEMITISKTAVAAFNAQLTGAGFPNKLELTNYSSDQIKNYWLFNDVSSADSSFNTTKNYVASGNYSVTLIAFGKNGCNDTSAYTFNIPTGSSITLPNIFTPNYDGINDVYKPITSGIVQLNARIFNRFGILVAGWDKVNGFWDGHTTSGIACIEGEYFIVVEAKGFDGKTHSLNSHISLLR